MQQIMQAKKPAVALYRFWDQILTVTRKDVVAFGEHGWALKKEAPDVISFGQMSGYCYFTGHFYLGKDGRFSWGPQWGTYRRNTIERHVPFVDYSHTRGRYQWFPSPVQNDKAYHPWTNLLDWNNPIPYIDEDVLRCRTYRGLATWVEQTKDEQGNWKFQPARKQATLNGHPYEPLTVAQIHSEWANHERLVERRYRLLRRHALGEQGGRVSARTPTLRAGRDTIPEQQAVSRLLAHLEVSRPAKTTPLQRPKEAHRGTDDMAPANQLR